MSEKLRRDNLLQYLRVIVQDLLERGVVQHRLGQSLDSIIAKEHRVVLDVMKNDVISVLAELGGKLALGGSVMAEKSDDLVLQLTAVGLKALGRKLLGKKT